MPVIWIVIGVVAAIYFGDIWFKLGVMILFTLITIFHYGYGELKERWEFKKREDTKETERVNRASLISAEINELIKDGHYSDAKALCDAHGLDLAYFLVETKRRAIMAATRIPTSE